jgi:hypothetical protein
LRTRFVLAFAATVLLGAAILSLGEVQRLNSQVPQSRPTISPSEGYQLRWRQGTAPDEQAQIAADGSGCEPLGESDFLYQACVLATNTDPVVIAGQAFGQLNQVATPAREALIWRLHR